MRKWELYEQGSYENHPFYVYVGKFCEWNLTIEDNGAIEIECEHPEGNEKVEIPQSVIHALLAAYARRTNK